MEKIIHDIQFQNPNKNSFEKRPEIIETSEKNYKMILRFYQCIFTEVADIFLEYIHCLYPNEIQQLDNDIKSNGWGFINLLNINNSVWIILP